MGQFRHSITEIYSAQVAAYLPSFDGELLRVIDLPQKPIFQYSGAIWLPLTGSFVAGMSAVAANTPADTTEDVLANVAIPAKSMGPNGLIRVRAMFTITNNANTKTMRIRFSGLAGTIYNTLALTTTTGAILYVEIGNRGATNSQIGFGNRVDPTAASEQIAASSAVDTTLISAVSFTGQKGIAGDTLTLESYVVEVVPAP